MAKDVAISAAMSDKELLDSIDKTLKQAEKRFDSFAAKATSSLSSLEKASFSIGSNIGKNLADGFNQNSVDLLSKLQQISSKITKINSKSGIGPAPLFTVNVNELNEAITKTDSLTKNFKEMVASTSQINKNLKSINAARSQSKAATDEARITLENAKQEKYLQQALRARQQAFDIAQKTAKAEARQHIVNAGSNYDSAMAMSAKTIQERMDKMKALQIVQRNLSMENEKEAQQLRNVNKELLNLKTANQAAANSGVELQKKNNKLAESFANLGKRVLFYTGLGALTGFVRSLVEVRGQYELLERSIGAVLGDFEKGSQIFREQQALALKSPFTVLDLAGATKQLAAYNFAAEDLVDTSRRLADISAALGVPMERLTYNLGQIKAQTVLMARDARDFANAGLPITQELAKMYGELENRAVSVGEVMDRMSNRMVSFGDVMKVINRYTDEGGMFFDFQAKQAETLNGQLSNLTDAYNNMLNELGTESQGTISSMIGASRTILENWRLIVNTITGLTIAYGSFKAVQLVTLAIQAKQIASTFKWKAYIDVLRESWYRTGKAIAVAEAAQEAAAKKGQKLNGTLLSLAKNPYALVAAGIAAIGYAIYTAYQNANKLKNELDTIVTSGTQNADKMVSDFDALVRKINQTTVGTKEFNDTLKKINSTYGSYLPNMLTEINYSKELAKNYNLVVKAINDKAKAQSIEKGLQAIEDEYGEKQNSTINKLLDVMDKLGVNGTDAKSIIRRFIEERERGLIDDDNLLKGFLRISNEYLEGYDNKLTEFSKSAGKELINDLIINYLDEFVSTNDKIKETTDRLYDIADTRFGAETYKSKEVAVAIEAINKKYEALEDTQDNHIARLKEMSAVYEKFGDSLNLKRVSDELDGLTEKSEAWKQNIMSIIAAVPNGMGNAFEVKPDDTSITYIERLKKLYKELTSQKELLKGTKTDDITKERIEGQLKVLEAISNALNVNLLSDKALNKEEKKEIDILKERIKLIKDIIKSNEELVKKTGNLTYAANQTKEAYQDTFNELLKGTQIDFSDLLSFNPDNIIKAYDKLAKGLKSEKAKNAFNKQRSEFMIEYSVQVNTASLNAAEKAINGMFQGYELELDVQGAGQFGSLFQSLFDYDPVTIDRLNEDVSNVLAGLEEQIKEYTDRKGVLGAIISGSDDQSAVNSAKAELNKIETLESNTAKYITKVRKQLNDTNAKYYADNFKTYQKIYNEFATYEDKRAEIERKRLEEQNALAVEVEREMSKRDELKAQLDISTDANQRLKIKKQLDDIQKFLDVNSLSISLSIDKKADNSKSLLDLEAFKETDLYQKSFEDMSRVSTRSLQMLVDKFEDLKDVMGKTLTPEQMKTFMTSFNQVKKELEDRDLFSGLVGSVKDWITASKELKVANQQLAVDEDGLSNANKKVEETYKDFIDPQKDALKTGQAYAQALNEQDVAQKKYNTSLNNVQTAETNVLTARQKAINKTQAAAAAIDNLNGLVNQMNELFGIAEDSELGEAMSSFSEGLSMVSAALGVAAAAMVAFEAEAAPVLAIGAAVAAVIGSILFFTGKKDRSITKEIKKSEHAVARLENAYKNLERAVKQSLGTAETLAKKAAIANQKLQLVELKRQLELEKSRKGKKRDEAKIIELEGEVNDLENTIKDSTQSIVDDMLGSNIKDAAEEFADSWIDAWKSGEDTMQSLEESFSDMIDNMIVKSLASTVVANRLKQMYSMIEKFMDKNSAGGEAITPEEARQIADLSKQLTPLINEDLKNIMSSLGIAFGSGVKDAALSSLQKGIQGVTEETAGAIESYLNLVSAQCFQQTNLQQQMVNLMQVNTGTNSQVLLSLRESFQVLSAIREWTINISTPAGNGVRVQLIE